METVIDYILNQKNNSWVRKLRDTDSRQFVIFDFFCKYLKKIGIYHFLYKDKSTYGYCLDGYGDFNRLSNILDRLICTCAFGVFPEDVRFVGDFTTSRGFDDMRNCLDFAYSTSKYRVVIYNKDKKVVIQYDFSNLRLFETYAIAWMLYEGLKGWDRSLSSMNNIDRYNNNSWMRLILRICSPYIEKFDKQLYFKYFCPTHTWKDKVKMCWYYLRNVEPPIRLIDKENHNEI